MISIIIPVYNEQDIFEESIKTIISKIQNRNQCELIVVDASQNHKNLALIDKLVYSEKGRAKQMNKGAEQASHDILYFLHLDSIPPKGFDLRILESIQSGKDSGCFQMRFDLDHWLLKLSGYMTRFNGLLFRGGDQSLFVRKEVFSQLEGYNEDLIILEDVDIIRRITKRHSFVVLNSKLITSARRYKENGVIYLQIMFGIIHLMNGLGFSQKRMLNFYKKTIK